MIPPKQCSGFVANMEMVLDVYKRPYDPKRPVLCMDESPRQLIAEAKSPIAAAPGQPARYDYEYRRCGTYNVFLVCEPLAGKRLLDVLETKPNVTGLVSWKQALLNTRIHNSSHLLWTTLTPILPVPFMKHFHRKKQKPFGIDLSLSTPQSMAAG